MENNSKSGVDPSQGKRALIIDDSKMNRSILRSYLEEFGYEAFYAVDGNDGLEQYKKIRPFLVFLDIVMPKMTGLELLRQIKALDPDIIVIMVSSFVSRQTLKEAKDCNADWFLMKPFKKQDVADIVNMFEKNKMAS